MEMETLRDIYVEELKDLWSAENQILKALPRMIKVVSHPQLKRAFAKHEKQSRVHVKRLERICKELGESPRGKKCVGMEGLLQEGKPAVHGLAHLDTKIRPNCSRPRSTRSSRRTSISPRLRCRR